MGKVYLPPDIVEADAPLLFLAGPVQSARDWQKDAIEIIRSVDPDINIASPRREYLDNTFVHEKQVDWETHFLRQAAEKGLILFWLAKEKTHDCTRAYAQTSRFELAEWKVRHERDGVKLVLGIEEGFSNSRYIRRRFSQDCPEIPIFDSLEPACRKAVELISEKY